MIVGSTKFKFKTVLQNRPNIACRLTCCHVPFKSFFFARKSGSVSTAGSRGNPQLTQAVGRLILPNYIRMEHNFSSDYYIPNHFIAKGNVNLNQVSTQVSPPQNNNHYMPYLDGLRALAVFGVLISHFAYNKHWLIENAQWGRLGVDLFFVLSGFLITQILLRYRDNSQNFKDCFMHLRIFYSRRALRIFPIYYLTILIAALLGYEPIRNFLFWHLTYTLNIAIFLSPTSQFGASHHFWSLAIEEQFYLIWPLIILLIPPKRLRYVMFGFIVIGVISRMSPIFIRDFSMDPLVNTRFDVLGLGALLALYRHQPLTFAKEKLFLLIAGVTSGLPLVILVMTNGFSPNLRPMANVLVEFGISLFFMGIIDAAAYARTWRILTPLGWKPIRYIGKISYGIYLYHPFVQLTIIHIWGAFKITIPSSSLAQLLLYSSGSILFASISWYLVERPINSLKKRIKPINENHPYPLLMTKGEDLPT